MQGHCNQSYKLAVINKEYLQVTRKVSSLLGKTWHDIVVMISINDDGANDNDATNMGSNDTMDKNGATTNTRWAARGTKNARVTRGGAK